MKMKITVQFEIKAKPEWYPEGEDPAETEQLNLKDDPHQLFELMCDADYTVKVEQEDE